MSLYPWHFKIEIKTSKVKWSCLIFKALSGKKINSQQLDQKQQRIKFNKNKKMYYLLSYVWYIKVQHYRQPDGRWLVVAQFFTNGSVFHVIPCNLQSSVDRRSYKVSERDIWSQLSFFTHSLHMLGNFRSKSIYRSNFDILHQINSLL